MILSDTHLGRPGHGAHSAEAIRPLWQGATRLIINGDVAELHDIGCRAQAAREVMRIVALCEADGVELTLLPGNHDPMLSDQRSVALAGGQVFVTHGDVLHPAIAPWNSDAADLKQLNRRALGALDGAARQTFEGRAAAVQYAAHWDWDNTVHQPAVDRGPVRQLLSKVCKAVRVMWYWDRLPRYAVRFVRQYVPEARFFVFGHYHRAGIWHLGGRVVINTGSYDFPGRPRAVVIDDDTLAVWPVVRRDACFVLGAKPLATYPLRTWASTHAEQPPHGTNPHRAQSA